MAFKTLKTKLLGHDRFPDHFRSQASDKLKPKTAKIRVEWFLKMELYQIQTS